MLHHSSSLDIHHVVVTRFNAPLGSGLHLNEHWLALRVRLLKQFLLPSLVAQTSQNYHWVVLLHEDTPPEIVSLFKKIERPKTSLIFIGENRVDRAAICHKISDFIVSQLGDKQPKWVVTTRIDSDDAVSKHMVVELQEQILKHNERAFFSFSEGCLWLKHKVQQRRQANNPFMTYAELFGSPLKIVYCQEHGTTEREAPLRLIETDTPRWMVVLHGRNLSNLAKTMGNLSDLAEGAANYAKTSNNVDSFFGPECYDDVAYFDEGSPFLPGTW